MDDLINRQDVLNLCDMRDKYKIPYEYDDGSKHIKGYDEGRIINVTKLKMLPPVNPQERTGHWIAHPKGIYAHLICDKCLSNAPYDCRTDYCPSCGARMESEKNE